MMKAGMNEEAFAEELGVSEKMKLVSSQPNTGLATFLTSPNTRRLQRTKTFDRSSEGLCERGGGVVQEGEVQEVVEVGRKLTGTR